MRRISLILAAALAVASVACSKDTESDTPATPTDPTTSPSGLNIAFDSGTVDADTLPVHSVVTLKLHVRQQGVGAPNVNVAWAVTNGKGTVSSASTGTDASGAASVTWTLGDTVGINTVVASITGANATLNKLTVAAAANAIVKVTPDSSAVVAGATVPITARVVDQYGNPVKGVTVSWTTSAGALSLASSSSGVTGNAATNLTTTAKGTYTVTATVLGKGSVAFKVVGL
jgi:adhesin/invasin